MWERKGALEGCSIKDLMKDDQSKTKMSEL